jgi:hypothetical protein
MAENANYNALTVISPLFDGTDMKDQDRARWHEPGQVGAVCDGVSSSLNSREGAQMVNDFIPSVFNGDVQERLGMVCDMMLNKRADFKPERITVPAGTTAGMAKMLRRVIGQKAEKSFQTTLVAVRLIQEDEMVAAEILKCGDSAIFAFTPEGNLLSSSLRFTASGDNDTAESIQFSPGDQMLVRFEGVLSEFPEYIDQVGRDSVYMNNWLVCKPVELSYKAPIRGNNQPGFKCIRLDLNDMLLVPKYLVDIPQTLKKEKYRKIHYSSAITPLHANQSGGRNHTFEEKGNATLVLPDHYYSGCYEHYRDRFPHNTHFLLCSDGFYSAFAGWDQLWNWLDDNHKYLGSSHKFV